jgi:hypothetical protein
MFWFLCLAGCGTTRVSDTQRTATEQLLVSDAVDQAVSQVDFRGLAGKTVYFDPQYLDNPVDRGYVISSLRQQLLASGATLMEDRGKATYVVEARSGGVGTDRHALLIGMPQMNVPTLLPGQPYQIPEIPLAKKTDQIGVAKVAVFAYNRLTGRPVWQSGVVRSASTSKDTWVLGLGPFQRGTIRDGTEFAGEPLHMPFVDDRQTEEIVPIVQVTQPARWDEPAAKNDLFQPPTLLLFPPVETASKTPSPTDSKVPPPPANANKGGQDETQPAQTTSAWNWPDFKPDFLQQMHDLQGRARQFPSGLLPDHASRP